MESIFDFNNLKFLSRDDKDDVSFYLEMFSVRQAHSPSFADIFHIWKCFQPWTNVSILMLNFNERKAADDYMN